MLASEMNGNDRQIIHRALGIPVRRLDIPQKILDLYEKAMYVRNANSQTGGSLPDGVLMTILMVCSDCIELPTAKPTKYGHLPTGTKMCFQESAWLFVDVEFVCVKDPIGRTYQVKYAGGLRVVGEANLFLTDPRQKSTPVPVSQKPEVSEVTPTDDPELAEKRAAVLDKIKSLWRLGKAVEACAPSTVAFTGTVSGYDDRGNVLIRRPDGSETAVLCDYLYPCAEPEIVLAADQPLAADPIVADDDDDDDDAEPTISERLPLDKRVEVCVPGETTDYFGTILKHGSGPWANKVQIVPDDGSGKRWVLAKHCYAVESEAGSLVAAE